MKTLLKNLKIVNHDKIQDGAILIENDKILDVVSGGEHSADETIDCKNAYAFPGFIDMHVHMREPGLEYKEDITSAALAAVAGGFTTALCMANTKPCIDNAAIVSFVVNRAKEDGLIDVLPYGAVTKGMKGEELTEMGEMLQAGAGGFSDDGKTIMNAEVMRRALEYARQFDTFIASHAIDDNLQGEGLIHEGVTSAMTGLKGIPAAAESTIVIRDILLAKLTKSRVHICHVSTKESVDLIRWGKEQGILVTAEAAPHHFLLTDKCCQNYDTNFKMSPPLREEADVEAIIAGLRDGTLDAIATDHAPHQADEKFVEFNLAPVGIIGIQTAISSSLELVRKNKLSLQDLARLMSYNPSRILKKDELGVIAKGAQADIAIIDLEAKYFFNETINQSKSKNSPFWGKELQGQALYTFKKGKKVWQMREHYNMVLGSLLG